MSNNPVTLRSDVYSKLQRLTELRAVEKTIHENDPRMQQVWAEMRPLIEELSTEFESLVTLLAESGLLTLSIDDTRGEMIPHYHHLEVEASTAFNNGGIWIAGSVVNDLAGCSLKRHKPGTEPLLYTWNSAAGNTGTPTRPILVWTGRLLKIAYLAGGKGWREGTKPRSILRLDLLSTRDKDQQPDQYNYYFDHYKPFIPDNGIDGEVIAVDCKHFGGGSHGLWSYEITLPKYPRTYGRQGRENRMDYLIYRVCEHHTKQIRRLKRRYQDSIE